MAEEDPMETLIEEELSSLSFSSEDSEDGWRRPTGLLLWPEEQRPLMERERRRPPQAVGGYMLGDILGCGGYSKVKDAVHTGTLARRAVKIVRRSCLRRIPFGEQSVRRETCLLGALRHPHVLRLHEVLAQLHPDKAFLVLDYCPLSLQALLDAAPANRLAAWQARAYLRQLCAAVCYLQARAIVHKDIKPANLLLAPDGRLTLADFGVAEALPLFSQGDTCTRSEGSPAFQPPEVANCEPSFSGFKLDVWSCGVTLYCMLLGVHPFLEGCTSVYQLQTRIAHYQVTFPSSLEAVSEEVLRGLMARLPADRWSADRLSQHAWVVRAAPPPPLPRVMSPKILQKYFLCSDIAYIATGLSISS
ncbi:serine/threonine-protein kinase stk11-like [Schistocerca gregaria]|uniref:serine/threonine-protein kinase stk11-like n=1 Tax=Schistocerca gregaria TaxID=7010 RepID=UPI00211DEC67|nr:serine/threonine-protein kinase stk11-like [Schistocerca gregaria]